VFETRAPPAAERFARLAIDFEGVGATDVSREREFLSMMLLDAAPQKKVF